VSQRQARQSVAALQEQHVRLALDKQDADGNARRIELQAMTLFARKPAPRAGALAPLRR
jgi:hypothetical protein